MARTRFDPHPDDEALSSYAGERSAHPDVERHGENCASCRARIAELDEITRLLANLAARQQPARRDLTQRALARLRIRRTSIENMNEIFAALQAVVKGLAGLFGGGSPTPNEAGPNDESVLHG
ncbi:MAG: hypothetical protein M3R51_02765 [Candidatus Eremiobacteraeota bacterium]|nr:hypothetical protein [Candidatus Eremiobacteraeota bacterium]